MGGPLPFFSDIQASPVEIGKAAPGAADVAVPADRSNQPLQPEADPDPGIKNPPGRIQFVGTVSSRTQLKITGNQINGISIYMAMIFLQAVVCNAHRLHHL